MRNLLKPDWKDRLEKARQEKERVPSRNVSATVIAAVLTMLVVTMPMAAFTYWLGSLTDKNRETSADERLYLEQRMKVFIATGEHFEAYRLNWSRLIGFAEYEWDSRRKKQPLTEKEQENGKKYWNDRDKAKDLLFADLNAARLFFSDDVAKLVDDFKKFDGEQHNKTVDKLPPIREWGKYQQTILEAMRKEVRRK